MASLTKTGSQTLLALQSVAASSVAVGAAFDVSTKLGGIILVRFGRRSATAAGAGVNIRLEMSYASAGTSNTWFTFATLTTAFAAVNSQTLGTVASGQNVLSMAATAGITVGNVVLIDNSTVAQIEWGRVKAVSANVSATIEDNLVNTQTGFIIYNGAEIYNPVAIPEAALSIRCVADGSLFTQAFAVEARVTTIDTIA